MKIESVPMLEMSTYENDTLEVLRANETILIVEWFLTWFSEVSVRGIDPMTLLIRDSDWCTSSQRSIRKWSKEVCHEICREAIPRPLVLYMMSSSR